MIYIIGDSHTMRLWKSVPTVPVDICNWEMIFEQSECRAYHVRKTKEYKKEVYMSHFPGATGYTSSYRLGGFPCIKKTIDQDSIIMPFFGYIDVKAHLPNKKNTEIAVKNYIENTLSFFDKNKIRFISPIPQFINALGSGNPNYDFEDRLPYYNEFKIYLNRYLNDLGLEEAISIEKILGVDRLDSSFECHDCSDCNSKEYKNFKLDHLKKEYSRKVLDGIVNQVI